MKKCKGCGEVKPITAYSKHAKAKDGRQQLCKPCFTEKYTLHHHKRKYFGDICDVEDCSNLVISRGYCRKHYNMLIRTQKRKEIRAIEKRAIPKNCIPWPATVNPIFEVVI